MNSLFVVGLTGPTGAGKSTVARVLAENGCLIIDADQLARKAVEPNTACLASLVTAFSLDILYEDGTLNRQALAKRAFATPESTALLNSIVHPCVIQMTRELLETAPQNGYAVAVIDAPLLFQAGLGAICHCTAAVLAPTEQRLRRICVRDGITEDQARLRMAAQPDDEYYTSRATVVLQNDGDQAQFETTAQQFFEQITRWQHAQ